MGAEAAKAEPKNICSSGISIESKLQNVSANDNYSVRSAI